MTLTEPKQCIYCGATFYRKPRNSHAEWAARKVCSRSCRPSAAERLWAQVERGDGCWIWRGSVTSTGYGTIRTREKRSMPVHRLAWELCVGPIPPDHDIHHTCKTPRCCNVDHMQLLAHGDHARVTQREKPKPVITHCPQGHAYDEVNTYINPRGARCCRACSRASARAYQAMLREAGIRRTPVRRDRVCGRCGEFKQADEFHVGNATYCAECKRQESRAWRERRALAAA